MAKVPTLDMKKFTWYKESRQLVASAADLKWPAVVWPDSIRVKSHHTGVTEQFSRQETLLGPEGQFYGLIYSPANVDLNVRVTVFSD